MKANTLLIGLFFCLVASAADKPAATPAKAADTAASASPPPAVPAVPEELSEEEEAQLAGGFHESSYELRTGVDIFESTWPDDVTIPGALDDL